MHGERGLDRLISFSDAVAAIAITLLVLPLVDEAGAIGSTGVRTFLQHHRSGLFAFALSFAVIGSFWYSQHQTFEKLERYNEPLLWSSFVWLISIVFLPFPTELIGSAHHGSATADALYIGTMLVTTLAGLSEVVIIVRTPSLELESVRGTTTTTHSLVIAVLMLAALVATLVRPTIGLWSLLLLLLLRPISSVIDRRGRRHATPGPSLH